MQDRLVDILFGVVFIGMFCAVLLGGLATAHAIEKLRAYWKHE